MLQTAQACLPAGATLEQGKYRVVRVIGQGGFGITYEGCDVLLNRRVAIKELFLADFCARQGLTVIPVRLNLQEYERFKERFLEEARLVASLDNSSNIVRVYGYFEENNTAYIVMEYIDGQSLQSIVQQRGSPLTESEAVAYIRGIAKALQAVHKAGFLHRDVNPRNVLVNSDGRTILIDFGAARQFIGQNKSHTIFWTPGYAPPEQIIDNGQQGSYTDVYALGATLYFLLVGQPPVADANRQPEIAALQARGVSSALIDTIIRSLDINYTQRTQSVDEFLAALPDIPEGAVVHLPPKNPGQTHGTRSVWYSNSIPIAISVFLGVALLIAIIWTATAINRAPERYGGYSTSSTSDWGQSPNSGSPSETAQNQEQQQFTDTPDEDASSSDDTPSPDAAEKASSAPDSPSGMPRIPAPQPTSIAVPEPSLSVLGVPQSIQMGDSFVLSITARNDGATAQYGSITVSFSDEVIIEPLTTRVKIYRPGDKIGQLNSLSAKLSSVIANEHVAELYFHRQHWGKGGVREMRLRITPTNHGALKIRVRCTLTLSAAEARKRNGQRYYNYPQFDNLFAERDQQNFPVEVYTVSVQ